MARPQVRSAVLPSLWLPKYLLYLLVVRTELMLRQILPEQQYGRTVDWWALGFFPYEMLLGQSPFRGDDEDEIFHVILEDKSTSYYHAERCCCALLSMLANGNFAAVDPRSHPTFVIWESRR